MLKKLHLTLLTTALAIPPLASFAAETATPAADATISLATPAAQASATPEALWRASLDGSAQTLYKDNIYKAKNNTTGDMIARIQPTASIVSNLDKHAVQLVGTLDAAAYASENDNDYVDGSITADGRYDFSDNLSFSPTLQWKNDHVDIGSFEDEPGIKNSKPTDYTYGETGGVLEFHPNSYLFQLGGKVDFYDYSNVKRDNGTININDDRDRDELEEFARIGYNITPNLLVYTHGGIDQRRYDKQIDSTALYERDSDGKTLLLGTTIGDKKDFKWLDINMGYLGRDYDNNYYPDVNTFGLNAEGRYQVEADWNFTLLASRSVEENTLIATSSYIQNRIRTEAAYNVSPEIEVAGNIRYTLNDFQVNKSLGLLQREDKIYEAGANTRYKLNDNYKLDLGYNYAKRTSNNDSVEYTGNTVMLSIIATLN